MKAAAVAGLLLVVGATTGLAQTGSDWKMYGTASISEPHICFYDAKGITRTPASLVRVWTKCLSQQDLEKVDIKQDYSGKIVENAANKITRGYLPPLALLDDDVDFDKAMSITAYEETAGIAAIQPRATIFYELNCAEGMSRELSINISVGDKRESIQTPRAWHHAPPATNGARLLKLVCPGYGRRLGQ